MKLRTLLLTAGVVYWGLRQKDTLATQAKHCLELAQELHRHYEQLQQNRQTLTQAQESAKEVLSELVYRLRIYQESTAPQLEIIGQQLRTLQNTLNAKKS